MLSAREGTSLGKILDNRLKEIAIKALNFGVLVKKKRPLLNAFTISAKWKKIGKKCVRALLILWKNNFSLDCCGA